MSHEQLIKALIEYYDTLAALNYISKAEIIYPTRDGHDNVDISAAREQGFGEELISLMRRLPYLALDCEDTPIAPATKPRSYLNDDFLDWSRDPVFQGIPMTKSTDLVLTNPGQYGTALIYDTENCKCVSWCPSQDVVPLEIKNRFKDQRAPDGLEYSHLPRRSAEELIGQWTRNWLSLNWLPYYETNGWRLLVEQPSVANLERASKAQHLREKAQIQLIQRGLRNVYVAAGWDVTASDLPSARRSFDNKLFEQKRVEWKNTTQALLDKAFHEKWTWIDIRERLNLQSESSLLDQETGTTCARLRL